MQALPIEPHGALLAYQDFPGEEPARVYIHGLGTSSIADFPAVALSTHAGGRRSILIDLLGYGFSERPADFDYSMESHAQTVATLLDSLGLKGCEVIGHSMGGSVIIPLADQRPDLVSRLVSVEGNLEPGPQEGSNAVGSRMISSSTEEEFVRAGYAGLLAAIRARSPGLASRFLAADPRAMHRTSVSLVSAARPTFRERFLAMTIPKVYIFGELTLRDNSDMAARAAELPEQGIPVFVVPGVGHGMGVIEGQTEAFAKVLAHALAS